MSDRISFIIPNHNGGADIRKCLEAVFASDYGNFEAVVVDDCSDDNSVEIIRSFPCKLIVFEKHGGASKARNTGAANADGKILFFIDSDCIPNKDALSIVSKAMAEKGTGFVVGGTYTREPDDKGFFSRFQSVFINYSETKNIDNADYIASHAMAIEAEAFKVSGGFPEDFMPIIEDVEFSHRLRRAGLKLVTNPDILVQHVFNLSFAGSIRNAYKKSKYWTIYSLKNKDLFADSGTASLELKVNTASSFFSINTLLAYAFFQETFILTLLPFIFAANIIVNRNLFKAYYETGGFVYSALAAMYYMLVYPLAVGTGALDGMIRAGAMGAESLAGMIKTD
ncbi:MAG: hypothetical protein IEMM0002_0743 [bacterium]|nr:MAG: hypothetical protein IEMM0002_0743 [bacterium]